MQHGYNKDIVLLSGHTNNYIRLRPFEKIVDFKNEFDLDSDDRKLLITLYMIDHNIPIEKKFTPREVYLIIKYGFMQSLKNFDKIMKILCFEFLTEAGFYENVIFEFFKDVLNTEKIQLKREVKLKLKEILAHYDLTQYDEMRSKLQSEFGRIFDIDCLTIMNWETYFQNFLTHMGNDYHIIVSYACEKFIFRPLKFNTTQAIEIEYSQIKNKEFLQLYDSCAFNFSKFFVYDHADFEFIFQSTTITELYIDLTDAFRYELEHNHVFSRYFLDSFFSLYNMGGNFVKVIFVFERFELAHKPEDLDRIMEKNTKLLNDGHFRIWEFFKIRDMLLDAVKTPLVKQNNPINKDNNPYSRYIHHDRDIFSLMHQSLSPKQVYFAEKSFFSTCENISYHIIQSGIEKGFDRIDQEIALYSKDESIIITERILIEQSVDDVYIEGAVFEDDGSLLILGTMQNIDMLRNNAFFGLYKKNFCILKLKNEIETEDVEFITNEVKTIENLNYSDLELSDARLNIRFSANEVLFHFLDSIIVKNIEISPCTFEFEPYTKLVSSYSQLLFSNHVYLAVKKLTISYSDIKPMKSSQKKQVTVEILDIYDQVCLDFESLIVFCFLIIRTSEVTKIKIRNTLLDNKHILIDKTNFILIQDSDGLFFIGNQIEFTAITSIERIENKFLVDESTGIFEAHFLNFRKCLTLPYNIIIISETVLSDQTIIKISKTFEYLKIIRTTGIITLDHTEYSAHNLEKIILTNESTLFYKVRQPKNQVYIKIKHCVINDLDLKNKDFKANYDFFQCAFESNPESLFNLSRI